MKALNPFEGEFYRETLQVSRYTREMFCLMEGRHVHPSTLYPGGVGTVPSIQLFTDYLVRLMQLRRVHEEVSCRCMTISSISSTKRCPVTKKSASRRILLGCWGSFQDPDVCDYNYRTMDEWGNAMFVTPGIVVDGELVTTNLVDINLGIRILLGSSYYEDWEKRETFVKNDPLGNPVDKRHPWNQTTIPKPQKRDFGGNYTWVMSPRWLDKRTGDHLALDTGGGPIARLWATALAELVDIGYVKSTGNSVKIRLPKTALKAEVEFEWKIPKWSNAIERDRARTYFQAYAAACALYFLEQAMEEVHAGRTADLHAIQSAGRSHRLRFPRSRARRPLASSGHPQRQDRQLSSVSADAVERESARHLRHAWTVRRRGAKHADLRGERAGQLQGHRYHARGAQFRSLSAVRRAHVSRQRQSPEQMHTPTALARAWLRRESVRNTRQACATME